MRSPFVDWGVASLSLAGQEKSGDTYVVKTWDKKTLASVIDGLGHGEQAAEAARAAAEALISHAAGSPDVVSLVRHCHEALLRTRGAVLSLALLDAAADAMTWIGIGNVDGRLFRADSKKNAAGESLLLRGGVVGYQLPALRPALIRIDPRDLLIFSTDGIRSGFEKELNLDAPPQQIADEIMTGYNRKTDDALVLAVRYLGGDA